MSRAFENILPRPREIVDDIRHLTRSDYVEAIDSSLKILRGLSGVCLIAQFGSVNMPGVSDIDMLVVTTDEDFTSVCEKAAHIPEEVTNGSYLFVHPITVIPHSLTAVSRVLHSLNNLRVLWGNATIVELLNKPGFPLTTINGIVWNSEIWAIALKQGSHQRSLRLLLLLLGNVVQGIAADYSVTGQDGKGHSSLRWGQEAREAILAAPGEQRADMAVQYVSEGLCKWLEADWEMQDWWMRTVKPVAWTVDACEVPLTPTVVLQLREEREKVAKNDIQSAGLVDGNVRKCDGRIVLALPSFYMGVILSIKSAFEPWLNFPHFENAEKYVNSQALDSLPWSEAIFIYRNAVREVREFSRKNGYDDLELFRTISCLPFGACFTKSGRNTSPLKTMKYAARRMIRSVVSMRVLTDRN